MELNEGIRSKKTIWPREKHQGVRLRRGLPGEAPQKHRLTCACLGLDPVKLGVRRSIRVCANDHFFQYLVCEVAANVQGLENRVPPEGEALVERLRRPVSY